VAREKEQEGEWEERQRSECEMAGGTGLVGSMVDFDFCSERAGSHRGFLSRGGTTTSFLCFHLVGNSVCIHGVRRQGAAWQTALADVARSGQG
jgi:hypothetical protein